MNYIKQINGFWQWRMFNVISHSEVDLYFAILHFANTSKWKPSFNIPNSTICMTAGISDRSQLSKIRNRLVQLELIAYKTGKKGTAGKYIIKKLYDENNSIGVLYDTNVDSNVNTNVDTNVDTNANTNVDTIHKHKHKQNKNNIINPISLLTEYTDNEDLRDALNGFVDMRKKMKKPLTDRALQLALQKLDSLANNDNDKLQIVNNAVMNSWQGFYPLKQNTAQGTDNIFLQMLKEEENEQS